MRQRVVADIPESGLSDICHHPPPRLPTGRLKRSKIKKPPMAVKKARLFAGTKRVAVGGPSPATRSPSPALPKGLESIGAPPHPSPRGGSSYLLCLRAFDVAPSPWGRLGWGFYVGWYAPLTTLTELRLHSPELRLPSPLGESWRGASAFYLLSHYTKRGTSRRFPPTWCGLLARAPRCSLY